MRPHNVPYVLLGAGLLWFGWFGFNAGSALAANNLAGYAFVNTNTATAAALLGWILVEKLRDGHATTLGAASGAVAGLVAITPAAGFVSPVGSIFVGLLAGVICCLCTTIKFKLKLDDALDVGAVHLVGGVLGALLIGFFGTKVTGIGVDGIFYGGGAHLLQGFRSRMSPRQSGTRSSRRWGSASRSRTRSGSGSAKSRRWLVGMDSSTARGVGVRLQCSDDRHVLAGVVCHRFARGEDRLALGGKGHRSLITAIIKPFKARRCEGRAGGVRRCRKAPDGQ